VHVELVEHVEPLECSRYMVTASLLGSPSATLIALARLHVDEVVPEVIHPLVAVPPGDAYNVTLLLAHAGTAGRAKLPSIPIVLPSSISPAEPIENILKYLRNLRIDPVRKDEVTIEPFPF
jgi:hypothetical protein